LRIILKIKTEHVLTKYRDHPDLKARLGENYVERFAESYRVRLGYGLHVGWSIEGAIGSEFKIDASYLSQHVNMSMRLEEGTKIYGIPFLISGPMYDTCTLAMQKECRLIDKVLVSGFLKPTEFYCCDLDETVNSSNPKKESKKNLDYDGKKMKRVINQQKINKFHKNVMSGKVIVANIMKTDEKIVRMREPFTQV